MKEEARLIQIDKEINALEKEKRQLKLDIFMRDSIDLSVAAIDEVIKANPDENFKIVYRCGGLNRWVLCAKTINREEISKPLRYDNEKTADKWLRSSKYKDITVDL